MTARDWLAIAGDVATVGTAVAALIFAVWSYRKSVQQTKLQNSSVLANTLKQQFESPECRESRKRLANELLTAHESPREPGSSCATHPMLERDSFLVLEIFEQLGYLVRRGVLDEGIVWSIFAWDIIRYAEALKQAAGEDLLPAARLRCGQPTLFSDFERLATRLRAVGIEEHPGRRDTYTWRELSDYLKTECGGISGYEDMLTTPDQPGNSAARSTPRQP